jgi:hypothetical protein
MISGLARRRFLSALGILAARPFAARAQASDRIRRVGVLPADYRESDPEGQARIAIAGSTTSARARWQPLLASGQKATWPQRREHVCLMPGGP